MLASASSIALGFLFFAFVVLSFSIYLALTWQVAIRRSRTEGAAGVAAPKPFGLPEAFLAMALVLFLLTNVAGQFARTYQPVQLTGRALVANFLFTAFVVCFVAAFLKLRGLDVDSLAGFSKISLKRALSTGVILILAAWPLIVFAEFVSQALGGGSSKQEIVELFNSSPTIEQRVMIIVLAVVVAPIGEEFVFRFFLYGVLRRYLGVAIALVFNSLLFAAAHTHLPSAAPLFVLASCLTLAYEWSGSILVSMGMHALFNAANLIFLAFPELGQQ